MCSDLAANDCTVGGGQPMGPGTDCATTQCPQLQPVEACCLPDGTCVDVTVGKCVEARGVPQGPGSICTQVTCTPLIWSQPPMFNPDSPEPGCFWGWDEPSIVASEWILADDWVSEFGQPVTDLHWWGSYLDWFEEGPPPDAPAGYVVSIWTDVPAGFDAPWSHPGLVIHQWVISADVLRIAPAGCDFHPRMQLPESCFRYDYVLPQDQWFKPDPGTIYWISIAAVYPGGTQVLRPWGWKTRQPVWNDDAVRIFAPTAPEVGAPYIAGEPIEAGWDLAFALTTLEETEACCFPDGTCLDLLVDQCLSAGGDPQGPGTNCANIDCPVLLEACCFPDGSCLDLLGPDCLSRGGIPQGLGTNCATTTCPVAPQPEACCFLDGSCQDLLPAACSNLGGVPQGAGTNCATTICPVAPQPEACCFDDGSCQDLLPGDCTANGGVPQGAGTDCTIVQCPQPPQPEACCFPDGNCQDLLPADCAANGGVPQGAGTDCTVVQCPQPQPDEACCLPDGSCIDTTPQRCSVANGVGQGPGTTCASGSVMWCAADLVAAADVQSGLAAAQLLLGLG